MQPLHFLGNIPQGTELGQAHRALLTGSQQKRRAPETHSAQAVPT